MRLTSIKPQKSPFPGCSYIVELQLDHKSSTLTWQEVKDLHEQVRQLCPARFAWWAPIPQELWFVSLIYYSEQPTVEELASVAAMRIDLMEGRQFTGGAIPLTVGQLITLRKWLYRCHSDWTDFAERGIRETGQIK
jgi:hypothetical protein